MGLTSAIIDSREPSAVQALTFGGIPTAVAPLDAGDLLATTSDDAELVIAHRAPMPLLHAMRDNLLFPVVTAMREVSPWAYLVITGHLAPGPDGKTFVNGVDTGWVWASVSGALLTVQELGVHVLQVPTERDYEAAVLRLGNRDRGMVPLFPQRQAKVFEDAELLLATLPNIGPSRVRSILAYCGSAAYALEWLTNDEYQNDKVKDVTVGMKRQIRHALGLGDSRILAVVARDEPPSPPLGDEPAPLAPIPPTTDPAQQPVLAGFRPADVPVTVEYELP